jgi:hypothetical protein
MAYGDPDGAGVGGWLAFFVLVMAVFSPLGVLITTATSLYGNNGIALAFPGLWTTIQAFEWSLAAIAIAGCWYIAWRLNKVFVWRTVRITIAGMWLLSVGSLVVEFIGISLITGVPVSSIAGAVGAQIVRPFIFCAIWTAYFLRSKRVANTYLRHDETEIAEVFG